MRFKNYTSLIKAPSLLLTVSVIALLINNVTTDKFLELGIALWVSAITYILSVISAIIYWIKNPLDKRDGKTIRSRWEYCDKVGYGLFTGGLVALVTSNKPTSSGGLVLIGFTCIFISVVYRNFQENSKKKEALSE